MYFDRSSGNKTKLCQNRKVDEIRFNNEFTNYVKLVVAYAANDSAKVCLTYNWWRKCGLTLIVR